MRFQHPKKETLILKHFFEIGEAQVHFLMLFSRNNEYYVDQLNSDEIFA